jgi:serine/threonine-protein kinase
MNNLYQYFSELISLTPDEQINYLDNNVTDEAIRKALESMLSEQAFDFTALFSEGMSLSEESISGNNLIGQRIGKYEITSMIGQGGMGSVFLANRADGEFEQQVAIKVIPKELFQQTSEQVLNHEAQSLAQLNHPNIVPIFDAGKTDQGMVYIVMRFLDGLPLNHYIKQNPLDNHLKLKLFIKLLDAVSHAHANQVLHRDIKPQNILVDEKGEPSLVDFGIARLLDDDSNPVNQAYLKALSFAYASPEQKSGEKITTASDVFSLGQVLKYMVTEQEFAIDASVSEKSIPSPIQAIIKKSTSEDVDQRYETVAQFKHDITLFLQNKPTQAYDNKSHNLKLWFKRNKLSVMASAAIFTIVSFGGAQVYKSTLEAQKQAVLADANLKLAENMLKQVDITMTTEFERQLALVETAKNININVLPEAQKVRFIKSLADAFKAIGEYSQYENYANQLFNITKGKPKFLIDHIISIKMLVETAVLYQKFDLALSNIKVLNNLVKKFPNKDNPRLLELLDWESKTLDNFLIPAALEIYSELKQHQNLGNLSIIQKLNIMMFDSFELLENTEIEQAINNVEKSLEFADKNISNIPIRYWIRHLILWDITAHDQGTPPDIEIFKKKVVGSIGRIENLMHKNHPVVTALALHIINTLSSREDKELHVLIKHFESIKLNDLAPVFRISQGVSLVNQYIDNGQHKKAYALLIELTNEIPLASYNSIGLYQVLSYFLYDFGKYKLMFENHTKIAELAEKHGNLSWSSYINSEICSQTASRDIEGIDSVCNKAVKQATELYGENGFWALEAKLSLFQRYRKNNNNDAELLYLELQNNQDEFQGPWKANLIKNFIHYYLEKGDIVTARKSLDEYNKLITEHTRSYSLGVKLLNATVLQAEEKLDDAIAILKNNTSSYCQQWPYSHSLLVHLRKMNDELNINPVDNCPDAIRWQDIVNSSELSTLISAK